MGWSETTGAPHELLDDGFAVETCDLLVIGCGNILRGDDAVGPVLIRHLHLAGVPDRVRLVDGGTSGMDVAFAMRGAARVVIVDASTTQAAPGTLYRVPADELATLPPISGLHTHNFRWDHALSFSQWLLGPERPDDITVFLIEAGSLQPGAELSRPVEASMRDVLDLLERDFIGPVRAATSTAEVSPQALDQRAILGDDPLGAAPKADMTVELTDSGYLHLPAVLAERYFPAEVLVARLHGGDLELLPLQSANNGGLLLKRRNSAGDRSLLVLEVLGFSSPAGFFTARWDDDRGALLVHLGASRRDNEDGGRLLPDAGPAAAAAERNR